MADWLAVRPATEAEVSQILGWTHALWGGGRSPARYEADTRALLGSDWGRSHYRFMVGLDGSGRLVTACKRYRLGLRLFGRPVSAVGFGAVFTPEHARGHGYAACLLKALMAESAAGGARLALLYSDIGPGYYERLGFQRLGTQAAEATAAAYEAPFVPLAPGTPLAAFEGPLDGPLAYGREADYRAFLLQRSPSECVGFAPKGTLEGFARVKAEGDHLDVLELGLAPGRDPQPLYRALRGLAAARGLGRVTGWLPRAAAAAGFQFAPLEIELPMAAALAGDQLPAETQLWAIDHF